jgi:hypothetical protein
MPRLHRCTGELTDIQGANLADRDHGQSEDRALVLIHSQVNCRIYMLRDSAVKGGCLIEKEFRI